MRAGGAQRDAVQVSEPQQPLATLCKSLGGLGERVAARCPHLDLGGDELAADRLRQVPVGGVPQLLEALCEDEGLGLEELELLFEADGHVGRGVEAALDVGEVLLER